MVQCISKTTHLPFCRLYGFAALDLALLFSWCLPSSFGLCRKLTMLKTNIVSVAFEISSLDGETISVTYMPLSDDITPVLSSSRLLQCILSIFPARVHQFYANIQINPFLYINDQFALGDMASKFFEQSLIFAYCKIFYLD